MTGYDLGEVLRGQLQGKAAPPAERDIETITGEILSLKQDAGNAILGIGDRLIEAKSMLTHGEWLPWLTERVEFSESTAQRFMRLSREWRNPSALTDLGATKALTLLALPPEERAEFLAANHIVDGQEKSVIDMTSRELEKAIRERDEARQAAEAAQADAKTAEESRAKMEADLQALEQIHAAAQEGEAQAREEADKLRAELEDLRSKPVEVAVETVADPEAIAKAREEAVAAMRSKLDAAEKARKAAEDKRKAAEAALAEARKQAGSNAAAMARAEKAEAELAEARRELEAAAAAGKAAAVNADPDLTAFGVLYTQAQETINKLQGLLLKVRGRGDEESTGKLQRALLAVADKLREVAG